MKYIVFDWDGTLHNTKKLYAQSVRKAYAFIVEQGLADEKEFTDTELSVYLGMTAAQMWADFMPGLEEEIRAKAEKIVGDSMVELVYGHEAVLYDGVEAVLDTLTAEGYELMILSNCKIAYLEAHREVFGLDKWIKAYYPAQKYDFISKTDILRMIMREYEGEYIVVGDRYNDIQAGVECKAKTVGCAYGFGEAQELMQADIIISDIHELVDYVKGTA